jgi:hypothetical protein
MLPTEIASWEALVENDMDWWILFILSPAERLLRENSFGPLCSLFEIDLITGHR